MRQVAWVLAFLAALAVLLAVPLLARRTSRGPDCAGRVVIVKGAHGEPLECVCIGGVLGRCFNPGP
jgi:hypothetical protein